MNQKLKKLRKFKEIFGIKMNELQRKSNTKILLDHLHHSLPNQP